jgi:hypothetical protein
MYDQARRIAGSKEAGDFAGGSVNTSRVTQDGQVSAEELDEACP